MTESPSRYHREVAEAKRAAILAAGTRLFLDTGYDGTSLAKVAAEAGVSRATLFRQFPTKAELFGAIVAEAWLPADGAAGSPTTPEGLRAGLVELGERYAALVTRPGMADLFRIVIAELPRFPELGRAHFDRGKMPFFDEVRGHLAAESDAGRAGVDDLDLAAAQFLGMIANVVLWPRLLLPDWDPGDEAVARAVDEAVTTACARYGVQR